MSFNEQETKKKEFKLESNGKYQLEYFPLEYVLLDRELYTQNHPKIQAILAGYPVDEVDIKLAQIAAYCEVMLDGDYTLEARIQLARILTEKLMLLREPDVAQVILPFS